MNYRKIYIAGHTGLVGSALVRHFSKQNVDLVVAPRSELDLTRQTDVETFISHKKPDVVIVACGRVGGIQANSKYPAEFVYENLMMEANLIHASWKAGVKNLLNFGSACIYPKECPQPMTIDHLMSSKLEPTNEPYALAKLAGLSLVSSTNRQYGTHYINAIPSNLYGPGDTFDLERCHVIAALIRRFHEAKEKKMNEVVLWGSGRVERDFLFVDDLVEACDLLLQRYDQPDPINIGAETPCTIRDLSHLIAKVVGFQGAVEWDTTKPDGAPKRLLEASALRKLGWSPKTDLKSGLEKTYRWFLEKGDKRCAS